MWSYRITTPTRRYPSDFEYEVNINHALQPSTDLLPSAQQRLLSNLGITEFDMIRLTELKTWCYQLPWYQSLASWKCIKRLHPTIHYKSGSTLAVLKTIDPELPDADVQAARYMTSAREDASTAKTKSMLGSILVTLSNYNVTKKLIAGKISKKKHTTDRLISRPCGCC